MPGRFQDEAAHLADFLTEVWVVCQRCETPGVVTCGTPWSTSVPRFACSGCALLWTGHHSAWAGPARGSVRLRCPHCGHRIEDTLGSRSGFGPREARVTCQGCGVAVDAPVEWRGEPLGRPHDPAFGLPLRLQAPCAGHVLWAYNPAHLAFLRDYLSAGLRERTPGHNQSLASRLPGWLKARGNREAVLRVIASLERLAAG